eukprot:COSAG02_NODE_27983_length_598_cov_5.713427_1_plen_49_part_01
MGDEKCPWPPVAASIALQQHVVSLEALGAMGKKNKKDSAAKAKKEARKL